MHLLSLNLKNTILLMLINKIHIDFLFTWLLSANNSASLTAAERAHLLLVSDETTSYLISYLAKQMKKVLILRNRPGGTPTWILISTILFKVEIGDQVKH